MVQQKTTTFDWPVFQKSAFEKTEQTETTRPFVDSIHIQNRISSPWRWPQEQFIYLIENIYYLFYIEEKGVKRTNLLYNADIISESWSKSGCRAHGRNLKNVVGVVDTQWKITS